MTPFDCLREFHEKFGAAINKPLDMELTKLRSKLIDEEAHETIQELSYENAIEKLSPRSKLCKYNFDKMNTSAHKQKLVKELADLMYVTIGAAVTFGLPLEEVFYEVHKSNMSKLGEDGKPIYREDGKVLKGPNYKEPDLEKFFK